jgi:hypothetical protein
MGFAWHGKPAADLRKWPEPGATAMNSAGAWGLAPVIHDGACPGSVTRVGDAID